MTEADVVEFVGYLFGAYATGWTSGYFVLTLKRAFDVI